ncbi:Gfo/Idh/MocA family oxidoreductase [Thalassospira sp.]|uniref:Gfo/Idh/MocA family protein n=1 Tax=Thalassospira sp. TaxID=1912094 RepID=UPI000C4735F4|nr:Gfo/Idh/MocA family oxidoreductase [Thalassospira sp.]MAL39180.1 oxidoreductase [Thalassospira sp.]HAY47481.1 oxidoreductase [Thalassospira sp.]|tara:strand:+ start:1157 stop:2224 length:1068 start_codon:yes stop_codon:yes gene_type:complete
MKPVRILVIGLGNMGMSHAKAYHALDGYEIVGICARSPIPADKLPDGFANYPQFTDFHTALAETNPDAVSINTYTETHADFAIAAFESGAHVFIEKPLAATVEDAERVVASARKHDRKLVIGYILRHHPSWEKFVEIAKTLGKPLVMRMNLNQQSSGAFWETHKRLLNSVSPIVDCGVHYLDIMCLMTGAKPMSVNAIGVRLSDDVAPDMYNYGQLQVRFDDGSVGWYEAGWGPMISETAFFVKDVIGPKGSVSITDVEEKGAGSADIDTHTKTNALRLHHAETDSAGEFTRTDEIIRTDDEPDHDGLCLREQQFFLKSITENLDLTQHMEDALGSLRIALAADQSVRTGAPVLL